MNLKSPMQEKRKKAIPIFLVHFLGLLIIVKLKDRASFFSFFIRSPCMKSASYEQRHKSARRGAVCIHRNADRLLTRNPPNITNISSIKHSSILVISVLGTLFARITVIFFNKINLSLPKTTHWYLRWPFFIMKHSWTNSFNLSFYFEWGIAV